MTNEIILTIQVSKDNDYETFVNKLNDIGVISDYSVTEISAPQYAFRDYFIDHIVEHGFSSLLNYTVTMEDVTTPSMSINDIEEVFKKYVTKLAPSKKLLIIDPYFYSGNSDSNTHELFVRLISPIIEGLEEIHIVSSNSNGQMKSLMHTEINNKNSDISIFDIQTNKFHDRFWINIDEKKGIVVGTSLNGIGNKISIVDSINKTDVEDLIELAKSEGLSHD